MENKTYEFGLVGLAVMGQNLARNVAHKGFSIAVYNRTPQKTDEFCKNSVTNATSAALTALKNSLTCSLNLAKSCSS